MCATTQPMARTEPQRRKRQGRNGHSACSIVVDELTPDLISLLTFETGVNLAENQIFENDFLCISICERVGGGLGSRPTLTPGMRWAPVPPDVAGKVGERAMEEGITDTKLAEAAIQVGACTPFDTMHTIPM